VDEEEEPAIEGDFEEIPLDEEEELD
jgi:hypothetical protein